MKQELRMYRGLSKRDERWVTGSLVELPENKYSIIYLDRGARVEEPVFNDSIEVFVGYYGKDKLVVFSGDAITCKAIDNHKRVVEWCYEEACFKLRCIGRNPEQYCDPLYMHELEEEELIIERAE